jgi:hypothetical protein
MYRSSVSPKWDFTNAVWIDHRPNSRFALWDVGTENGEDDIVFDKETGLVWERCPAGDKKIWDAAIVYAFTKAKGGRKGWRLPTIEELLTLVDPAHANPTLPAGHPFLNIRLDDFYSSSTLGMTSPPTYAWGYRFGNGDTSNCLKTTAYYVWLVRGGFGHDYPF